MRCCCSSLRILRDAQYSLRQLLLERSGDLLQHSFVMRVKRRALLLVLGSQLLNVRHDLALLSHQRLDLRLRLLLSGSAGLKKLHVALVKRLQFTVFRPQQLRRRRQALVEALLVLRLKRPHELLAERGQSPPSPPC